MCRYRYEFPPSIPDGEVETLFLLSLMACESVHGELQTQLDAAYRFDADWRSGEIDAGTAVGRHLNRLFLGFLRREHGPDAVLVERLGAEMAAANIDN